MVLLLCCCDLADVVVLKPRRWGLKNRHSVTVRGRSESGIYLKCLSVEPERTPHILGCDMLVVYDLDPCCDLCFGAWLASPTQLIFPRQQNLVLACVVCFHFSKTRKGRKNI